jgi:Protein of unknown function (DUF3047)
MPGGAPRAALVALALGASAGSLQAQELPPLVAPDGRIGKDWRVVGLPGQKLPLTQYAAVQIDGRAALRIEARGSYGNVVHDWPRGRALPRTLRWTWRVDQPNTHADLTTKAGDDAAARVCLSFDHDIERVPFVERQLLRMARARSGEALPAATLCYQWDARLPPGTLVDNVYSRRVRILVLRGQGAAPGTWFAESRDIAADFLRAFGDEAREVPALSAVIVAGDADNTGASTLAYVADLQAGAP